MHLRQLGKVSLAVVLLMGLTSCATAPEGQSSTAQKIQTVVVIYAENHSFDNMYGLFPGANGIANATVQQKTQLDHDGQPLKELIVFGHDGQPDPKFPRMPNAPFRIDAPPVSCNPSDVNSTCAPMRVNISRN